jgi:ankyrin repeat protein
MCVCAGANPNQLDFDGATPLHLAVEAQDEELMEVLLQGGANPSQHNKDFTRWVVRGRMRGLE